jgi:hypothetical protein
MSTIYKQERNHDNWTGRVPRQARITGQWSINRKTKIPFYDYMAVVLGTALLVLIMFV